MGLRRAVIHIILCQPRRFPLTVKPSPDRSEIVTTSETKPLIRLRGRSIMALVLAPEVPLENWLGALDAQMERSPNFFDARPVVVDLGSVPREQSGVVQFLHLLEQRGIRIIGTEGAHPAWDGIEAWGRPLPISNKPP